MWCDLARPLELIRSGRLRVEGERTVDGREVYVVALPEGSAMGDARLLVAKDDGALIRLETKVRAGIWDPRKSEDEQTPSPLRTSIQEYPVYEVLPPTPENLALTRTQQPR